jgi:hypothetical protein
MGEPLMPQEKLLLRWREIGISRIEDSLGPCARLGGGESKATCPETKFAISSLTERENRKVGAPIGSVKDNTIIEMKAVFGGVLKSIAAANRIHAEKALRTKETNRSGGNVITRKLDLDLLAMNVKDPPSDETFAFDRVSGRKVSDFDVTGGIVRTKVRAAWTDTARCARIHNERNGR